MKNVLKVFTVLALVALLFTACGEKTTVYTCTDTGYDGFTIQFIFNGDGTFVERCTLSIAGTTSTYDWYRGTYSGNPKKDGIVNLTFTQQYDEDSNTMVIMAAVTLPVTISGGRFTFGNNTFSKN